MPTRHWPPRRSFSRCSRCAAAFPTAEVFRATRVGGIPYTCPVDTPCPACHLAHPLPQISCSPRARRPQNQHQKCPMVRYFGPNAMARLASPSNSLGNTRAQTTAKRWRCRLAATWYASAATICSTCLRSLWIMSQRATRCARISRPSCAMSRCAHAHPCAPCVAAYAQVQWWSTHGAPTAGVCGGDANK